MFKHFQSASPILSMFADDYRNLHLLLFLFDANYTYPAATLLLLLTLIIIDSFNISYFIITELNHSLFIIHHSPNFLVLLACLLRVRWSTAFTNLHASPRSLSAEFLSLSDSP